MRLKIVTLPYTESLGGFPQQAVDQACAAGTLIEVRDHFFMHGGIPHLALVLVIDDAAAAPARGKVPDEDPGRELPEELQALYRALRQWRNDRAKTDGVPAYVVLRNSQLAEICRKLPRTLVALRGIEGIGEATAAKYGKDLLALIPPELKPPAAGERPRPLEVESSTLNVESSKGGPSATGKHTGNIQRSTSNVQHSTEEPKESAP